MWQALAVLCIANSVSGLKWNHKDGHSVIGHQHKRDIVDDYHYKCNIYSELGHICTCVIISKYEVVTLAQCVHDWKEQELRVRNLVDSDKVEFHDVAAVEIHPGYNHRNVGRRLNDIAVLRIRKPIVGDEHYATLSNTDVKQLSGRTAEVFGFLYQANSSVWEMESAFAVLEKKTKCDGYILGGLAEGQFCATNQRLYETDYTPQTCLQDKGAIIAKVDPDDKAVLGLASDWEGECSTEIIYTDIAFFLPFIKTAQEKFKEMEAKREFQNPKGTGNSVVTLERGDYSYYCTGVLYSDQIVITSAVCAQKAGFAEKWSRTSKTSSEGEQRRKMSEACYIQNAARYRGNIRAINDIAVYRLDQPFDFGGDVSAIDFYPKGQDVPPGRIVEVTLYDESRKSFRKEKIQMVNRTVCDQKYLASEYGGISKEQVCAEPTQQCEYNVGSPLIDEKYLVGISTFSSWECNDPRYPGVYTDVSKVRDDIEECIEWLKKPKTDEGTGWVGNLIKKLFG